MFRKTIIYCVKPKEFERYLSVSSLRLKRTQLYSVLQHTLHHI